MDLLSVNLLNSFLTQHTLSASTTSCGSKIGKFPACCIEKYITTFICLKLMCRKRLLPALVLQDLVDNSFCSFCPFMVVKCNQMHLQYFPQK